MRQGDLVRPPPLAAPTAHGLSLKNGDPPTAPSGAVGRQVTQSVEKSVDAPSNGPIGCGRSFVP